MAFDSNIHVVRANTGDTWIQIDALVDLLSGAKAEFVSRGAESDHLNAPAFAEGCGYVCDELRLQLMKLTVLP